MFEILGYSERGVINALFYDILNSSKSNKLISDLLNKTIFINDKKKERFKISSCIVLIEQSFSDFGDSDLLLLIENKGKKQAVFLEAKVKTYSGNWNLIKEFNFFLKPKDKFPSKNNQIPTSNLFTQLYFKHRLCYALKKYSIQYLQDLGIEFVFTTKEYRKIGKNEIVKKAVKCLLSNEYLDKVFYFGIVPDSKKDIVTNSKKDKETFIPYFINNEHYIELMDWDSTNWGFIAWEDIEVFCKANSLDNTCNVFEFNTNVVYNSKNKTPKKKMKRKSQIY